MSWELFDRWSMPVIGVLIMFALLFFPRVRRLSTSTRAMVDVPGAGPYRTAAKVEDASVSPDPIADMARAIEDATALANAQLREGKLSPHDYGVRISSLETAAQRAADLQRAMRKVAGAS